VQIATVKKIVDDKEFASMKYHASEETRYLFKKRLKLMEILGGKKCSICGYSDERTLQFAGTEDYYDPMGRKWSRPVSYYLNYLEKAKNPKGSLSKLFNFVLHRIA
jgi:hypothetical protein